jgi:hypothetical protein
MRYLLMIVSDGQPSEAKAAANATGLPAWLEATADTRLYGERLQNVDTAVTVRTRGGQVFTSDGPFAESKEWIAGFDIIDCDDLDVAIEIAAGHPVAAFHHVEVRPFLQIDADSDSPIGPDTGLPAGIAEGPTDGRSRFLMLMCVNGVAEPDEEEVAVARNSAQWGERLTGDGVLVYGRPLQGVSAATTVSVRDGDTVISDGPFVDAKEFIGGFAIVDCHSREEAVAHAATHPLAHYHRVEVRPFWKDDRAG